MLRDPFCRRCVCIKSSCPRLESDDGECADYVEKPEMDKKKFLEVCAAEERMILLALPDRSEFTNHAFLKDSLLLRSNLPKTRAELAFKRLLKYKIVCRRKNYNNGYEFFLTEKGVDLNMRFHAEAKS